MKPPGPRPGKGRFGWNSGGWFGAQFGGTIWLLLLGLLLSARDPVPGGVAIGCFLLIHGVGFALWGNRHRIAPYPAIQGMLAAEGLFALVAVAVVNGYTAGETPIPGLQGLTKIPYGVLLIFPGLMLQFHVMERAARGRGAGDPGEIPSADSE